LADGKVIIDTGLDTSGIEKDLSKMGKLAKTGLKTVATAVSAVSTALGGTAAAAVKVGVSFESEMSKVSAISGATGDELQKLTDKAKEMGAKTKFSASESAQAMEYMAMAGWKTQDMLSGIEGIMDLAAASGEDLATTSDIVTDALTAMGLAASDSTHFANVLAAASSNANTNVSMMGETFKYAAPVAGALGYNIEDLSQVIGLMANSGIKGTQAGTALRSVLTRLAKPPKEASAALDKYDISMKNADGSMKTLMQVMENMRDSLQGLPADEQAAAAAAIGGQEAMSGLLAIVNASQGDFDKLASAIKNADGTAANMSETMQDNLEGAVTILKSSLEGLGIEIYESLDTPLKNTAVQATQAVGDMTDAFKNGGLKPAVKEAGNIFADFAVDAASHAPEMVDTAVDFIESFVSGVSGNKGRLLTAAAEVAESIAGGLASLLPAELKKPAQDAVEALSESLNSGGLKSAGKKAVSVFKNLTKAAGTLAKVALPPVTKAIDLLSGNLGVVAPLVAGATTALKLYSTATKVSKNQTNLNAAALARLTAMEKANALQLVASNGGLTIRETLMGVYSGQIGVTTALTGLWTKAQTALNAAMASNPIGLLVTAGAALAACIGTAILLTDDEAASTDRLTEAQKENIQAATSEIDNAEALWGELQKIVDANGKVQAGQEARAAYITGELSSALGVEISLNDGLIQNYSDLKKSVYDLIAAKKAEAVLDSMKSDYADAMKEQADKAAELADAYEKLSSKKSKIAELEKELEAESANAVVMGYDAQGEAIVRNTEKYGELKEKLEKAGSGLEELQANFDAANAAMQDNQKVISDYSSLTEAAMSGNTDTINSALAEIQSGIDTTLEIGSEAAIEQASAMTDKLTSIFSAEKDGAMQLTQQTKDGLTEAMGIALNQVGTGADQIKEILKNAGKDGSAKLVAAMAQAKISGTLSTEAQAGMESFLKGFSGLDEKTKETWSQAWYGALEGLEGFETLVDPAEQGADAFLQSLITTLDVHSPSRAVKEIFSYVWPGAVEGLNEGQEELTSSGTGVISRLLDAMRGSVGDTKEIGSGLMTSFNEGIGSQLSVSEQQGKANAEAAKRGAGAVDPTSTGSAFGRFFDTAIGSFVGKLLTRGKGLADSAKRGAGSVNPGSTGKSFGTAYSSAVGSKAGDARAKGTSLATSAKSGAGSINSYDTGSNFGSGFVRGIGDWVGKAASKAAEMASTAYEKVKSVLGIHSPSKVMRGAGRFSGKGFALGIDDQIPAVKKASERMARSALNSLDMADLSNRVREAMAVNTNRITSSFALQSTEKIINQQSVQSTMRISDEDLTQLATKVGNATAAGVKKMQSRPVYLGTTRLDRELPKGAVPKI
jgi:TP901 family phage tail tape measure protein